MRRRRSDRDLLIDLRDHLDKAQAFTAEGREAFFASDMAQFALIRAYEVIGEVAKRLSADLRDSNPQVDWRKLSGFRDFLAHNYDEIIVDFLWQAVEDIPALRAAIDALLAALPPEA